jgi:N-acetylglucosaminyl-diphospho-decaprenol L-rhamnosyltransferase
MKADIENANARRITISIVNHGSIRALLALLDSLPVDKRVNLVIILNTPISEADKQQLDAKTRPFATHVIENRTPKGFGANHNAAFEMCTTDYFLVLNPDIIFTQSILDNLLACLDDTAVGVVAPEVQAPNEQREDSARRFPTVFNLIKKALKIHDGRTTAEPGSVDWIAGMFMLYRSAVFRELGGFDSRYFLYYEDVDICVRLWRAGYQVCYCPEVAVIHDAKRDSHKQLKYFFWHLNSIVRYLMVQSWRLPRS